MLTYHFKDHFPGKPTLASWPLTFYSITCASSWEKTKPLRIILRNTSYHVWRLEVLSIQFHQFPLLIAMIFEGIKKENNKENINNYTVLWQQKPLPKPQPKLIRDLNPDFRNPNFWTNPDSDRDVCRIVPKCCGFIILLVSVISPRGVKICRRLYEKC